jgi:tetratricopeptide (TPR) repeat protein
MSMLDLDLARFQGRVSAAVGWLARGPARLRPALAAVLAAGGLAGCATPGSGPVPAATALFHDEAFVAPSTPVDTATVFALDDEMREYVKRNTPSELRTGAIVRDRLLEDLFTRGRLQLDYESSRTRTASEAFEAKRGNCLSLVILTGALARELDLDVTYQSVETEETWSRAGDLYFLSGHVNVVLGQRRSQISTRLDYETMKVVDFLPPRDQGGRRTHEISERTVLAMYMNNRAAESLIGDHVDDAYWFAKEAIRLDPRLLIAYNTLGVIYLHRHDAARAEHVLRSITALEPDNPRVLGNLAAAVREQGRIDEAKVMEARLLALEPDPPFHYFVLGQLAMLHGDYEGARRQFLKELAREPDYHEFHFWLAQAELRLGDYADARKHLAIAMETSTRRTDRDLYAAKLDRLRAAGVQ